MKFVCRNQMRILSLIKFTTMAATWFFEMSQGAGVKMFTLWKIPGSGCSPYARPVFVKNLSIDKDKALEEGERLAKAAGLDFVDSSRDTLRRIVREGDGLMPFGKYYGTPFGELPEKYLLWVAQGGPIKKLSHSEQCTYTTYMAEEGYVKQSCLDICLQRGLMVIFEGKAMPKAWADKILEERIGWGHHADDKARLTLTLEVTKVRSFESQYGTVFIQDLRDIETGSRYAYKGSSPALTKEDGPTQITATVKLGEYRDTKITYLQRIKVMAV